MEKEPFTIIYQEKNQGKGSAIRKAIENIKKGTIAIVQDADLEYDPMDYLPMIKHMTEKKHKVVYGSRFLNRQNRHSYFSFYIGGQLVTWITNILYFQNLTDEPTCYKLFEVDFLKSIPLKCQGFEFCPEITAKVAKRGIKIPEIPIQYFPRKVFEGKKITWKDGIQAILTLVKYRFKT